MSSPQPSDSDFDNLRDADIAIVALAGRFPGSNTIEEFWQNLQQGVESFVRFSEDELQAAGIPAALYTQDTYIPVGTPLEGVEEFDARFFGFNAREAELLDPQQRLFLECAWECLERGGYDPTTYGGAIGVYGGMGASQYLLQYLLGNPSIQNTSGPFQWIVSTDKDFIATRVAYKLGLTGPALTIQTACSTSLVAVHVACQGLLNGECDLALAGGVSIKLPQISGYTYQPGMILSPDGRCRAFDARAQGTVGGSGVGLVLLKRLKDAVAEGDTIYATIRGTAVSNDGSLKVGFTAPSVNGQAKAIAEAQAVAEASADSITYIEAHGTATELGDPIEIEALTRAFRQTTTAKGFCAIGSLKTNMGHLDAAAGVAGLMKATLALQHKQIPPSLHFETPNPKIDFTNSPFFVNTALRDWPQSDTPRRAGVSSFGIGGTNAHAILEEAPVRPPRPADPRPHLLVLSAKTESALARMAANLADCLQQNPDLPLVDAAYTLSVGRRSFPHRRVLVASTTEEAVAALQDAPGLVGHTKTDDVPVFFLFPGQGSQYVNMGRELYDREPVFRECVDRCAKILEPHLGIDLRALLYPEPERTDAASQQLNQTAIAQPALFVVEYAMARLWQSWGIAPQGAIGHSIGEYVAACLAGVFDLEAALGLLATRGRLSQQLPPGGMLSVPLPAEKLQPLPDKNCAIAATNEPNRCVVSGPLEAIAQMEAQLATRGVESRRLHTSHAFHSPMMDPILEAYERAVAAVSLHPPQMPFISSTTGTWITPDRATDPHYWSQHLRGTVRFSQGLESLLARSGHVLLEVGPGRTLSTFAKRHPQRPAEQVVLTSMRHPQESGSDLAVALQTLGRLWMAGGSANWSGVYDRQTCYRIPLPTYPFERQRYWADLAPTPANGSNGFVADKPAADGSPTVSAPSLPTQETTVSSDSSQEFPRLPMADWFYVPSWKRVPMAMAPASVRPEGCWLIFLDRCGLGASVVAALREAGETVRIVEAGAAFEKLSEATEKTTVAENGVPALPHYRLNPARAEDYQALIQDLKATDCWPTQIVHLWTATRTPTLLESETLKEKLHVLETLRDLGFYSLIFLVQAMGKYDPTLQPCQVTVISNGMQAVLGADAIAPEKATLLGPVETISLEYPHIACRSIDLELDGPIGPLLDELRTPVTESAIAYRGGQRWIRTFEPVPLPPPASSPLRLKSQGVYLITGGLGGIALEIATDLAKTVCAKLVLVGRSPLPPRSLWQQYLVENPSDDPTCQKIQKILQMEELGSEVLVLSADVADPEAMERAIDRAQSQFGTIRGVIHAAGVPSGGLIQLKTRAIAAEHMSCKLQGTVILANLLQDCKLDFFVLFSTLNTALPTVGQVDHAGGNAFMDAFAWSQSARSDSCTLAINWDGWQEVGQAAVAARDPRTAHLYSDSDLDSFLSSAEGVEAFARILQQSLPQVIVSAFDLHARRREALGLDSNPTRPGSIASPAAESPAPLSVGEKASLLAEKATTATPATAAPAATYPRPDLPVAYVAPQTPDERAVVEVWQNTLGVAPIGVNDNFLELGGDSLIATQVVTRLREVMANDSISVASLFATPTVALLVASLQTPRVQSTAKVDRTEPSSTEREEFEL